MLSPPPAPGNTAASELLLEALLNPAGTFVNVAAWVVDVSDLEMKRMAGGEERPMRVISLAPALGSPTRIRWVLLSSRAESYGPKQILKQKLRLRGVQFKLSLLGGLVV